VDVASPEGFAQVRTGAEDDCVVSWIVAVVPQAVAPFTSMQTITGLLA